ncbi:MAG: hypothetical protein KDK90_18125 [Leptospiraceae bacterium]|nr:hypothetical protein [Leptospiraceae bacterium]
MEDNNNSTKLTPEQIIQIIDKAAEETMNDEKMLEGIISPKKNKQESEKVSQIIDNATQEILKKEQADYLISEIKNRFLKIKGIQKENFNMFEVVLHCHKLVNEYKKLARLNSWSEIEALLDIEDV